MKTNTYHEHNKAASTDIARDPSTNGKVGLFNLQKHFKIAHRSSTRLAFALTQVWSILTTLSAWKSLSNPISPKQHTCWSTLQNYINTFLLNNLWDFAFGLFAVCDKSHYSHIKPPNFYCTDVKRRKHMLTNWLPLHLIQTFYHHQR